MTDVEMQRVMRAASHGSSEPGVEASSRGVSQNFTIFQILRTCDSSRQFMKLGL